VREQLRAVSRDLSSGLELGAEKATADLRDGGGDSDEGTAEETKSNKRKAEDQSQEQSGE
jgi:hypothetical protein